MASEFPYIQLYVADYLADTVHLSTEEHGAYLLLIMNYWQTGKPIPKSRLASAARMLSGRWTDVEQTLKEFFKEDEQGRWVHPRIEQELAKVRRKSRQASAAGKASAKKRAEMQNIDVKEDFNGRSTEIQRTFNHTDTDTDTDTEKTIWMCPSEVDKQAWAEFEQHRKEIRKPLTDLSRSKAANVLSGYSVDKQRKIVDLTVQNRWTGLFHLKEQGPSASGRKLSGSGARPGESWEDYERRVKSERERQGNGSKGVFSGSYGD